MKKLILSTILLATMSVPAVANMQCGFKPFKPLGCGTNAYAVCQCDANGDNCQWVWVNCG